MTLGQLRPLHWKGTILLVSILALLFSACGGGGGGGNAAPPAPDFSLSVSPPASIPAGASGTTQVSVTRSNGHSAGLALSLAANGPSITGSGTIATGAAAGTLNLNVPAGAAPGAVTLTVNASDGTLTRSAAFTLTVTPGPDFSISVAPPSPIPAGGSGPGSVTVTRSGGHSAALTLSLAANAQNITGSGAIPASAASGNLLLTVPATVAPGAYTLTCNGDDGSLSRSVAFSLTVAAPPAFTFGLGASSVSMILGGRTTPISLTLTRLGGFTAPVAFTVFGLPPGVSAFFTPPSTAGNSATLILLATTSATTGVAALTVRAAGGGVTQDLPLAFTLSPVGPAPVTLSTWVNGAIANTTWVAWRDGLNGGWTVLAGNSGVYSFTVTDPSGRFSVASAFAGDANTGPQVKVLHASVGGFTDPSVASIHEGPPLPSIGLQEQFGDIYIVNPGPQTHLTGTISNGGPNSTWELFLNPSPASSPPWLILPLGNPPTFSLNIPQGSYSGVAVERGADGTGLSATIIGNTSFTSSSSTLNINRGTGFFNLLPVTIPVDTSQVTGAAFASQAEVVPTKHADDPATFLFTGAGGNPLKAGFFPSPNLPPGWTHRLDGIAWNSDFSLVSWQTQFLQQPPAIPNSLVIPPLPTGVQTSAVTAPSGRKQIQVSDTLLPVRDASVFLIRSKIWQDRPPGLPFMREDRYFVDWPPDSGAPPSLSFSTVDLGDVTRWNPNWNIIPGVKVTSSTSVFTTPIRQPDLVNFLERSLVWDGIKVDVQNSNSTFTP